MRGSVSLQPDFDWFVPEPIPDEDDFPFWAWRNAQPDRTPDYIIEAARRDDPRWAVRTDVPSGPNP